MDLLMTRSAELLVWAQSHPAIASVVAVVLLTPGVLCCLAARRGAIVSRTSLARIDQRLTQVCGAVDLLTDTTESALQSAFAEIERLTRETTTQREALHTRVKKAARNGRTAREIAQSEGVSEGEVRLRLRLNADQPTRGAEPCLVESTAH